MRNIKKYQATGNKSKERCAGIPHRTQTLWRKVKENLNKWTDDVHGSRYLILLRFQFSPNSFVDAIEFQ